MYTKEEYELNLNNNNEATLNELIQLFNFEYNFMIRRTGSTTPHRLLFHETVVLLTLNGALMLRFTTLKYTRADVIKDTVHRITYLLLKHYDRFTRR